MSCDGTMIGSPFAGERMLFEDSISVRASICASSDSGTWTAIWSPSKSALNAAHTSGCSWIDLPSIRTGSNAPTPTSGRGGCGWWAAQHTPMLADVFFPKIPHDRLFVFHHLLGSLDRGRQPQHFEAVENEGLKQFQRHLLRKAALMRLQRRCHN